MMIRGIKRGFTMIELAISVAMATIVVLGLYGIFTMQSRQLLNQDMRMEMHQNARFAMEILSRSIRMAGFGSRGSIVGEMGTGGDSNAQYAVMSNDGYGTNGSDAITIAYMEPSLVMNTAYSTVEACTTSTITFDPNHLQNFNKLLQFRADDLLMCYDYAAIGTGNSYLWSITSDASTSSPYGTINVDASIATSSDFSTACPSTSNISSVIRCSKGQVMTFYIDDTDNGIGPGSPSHPVLMMDLNNNYPNNDDVPLVDNVEDLQFQYCIDDTTNTQNCANRLIWDNSVLTTEVQHVWMVRILMVVRSPKENYEEFEWSGNVRPALGNNSASTSNDGFYRDIVVTEVAVRNMRLF
jgi:prepilin-type N-terminal cleavage/methylation domain-containing protein